MMLEALDGPSKQFILNNVDNTTPVKIQADVSVFEERKVITLQGNGKFYVYFSDENEVPSAATVSTSGFIQYKNSKESYEASGSQAVYVLAVSGDVDIRAAERA